MPNTQVFTGADGSITLSTPQGAEGEAAKGVIENYEAMSVGRVQDVQVEVTSDVRPFHEMGKRYPTQLRPGNVDVRGTIGRAYVNGAMLGLLLGEALNGRPQGSWPQPSFNMTLVMDDPAQPDVSSTVTLHGVKLEGWSQRIPEDDFVLESVAFRALFITVQDEG